MRLGPPWGHRFFAWVLFAVLAVMLPLLALHAHTLYVQHRAAQDAVHQQVLARSADTAVVLNQTFARAETLLRLLASREDLRSLDAARCERVLEGLAGLDPLYGNVAVADAEGAVVCASVQHSPRRPLRLGGARWQAALASDDIALSKPASAGPILGRPVAVLTLPLRDASGRRIGLVGLSLDLITMAERVLATGLPPGGSMTLVDAEDTVFTRYPDAEQWVGTQLPRTVRVVRRDQPQGVVSAAGPDGVTRVYATTPLAVHGLRLASGIPSDLVLAAAREHTRRSLLVTGLTLLAALLLALYAARWLSAPLQSLVRSARAWGEGRNDARADEALPGDFGTLAQEFNRMIDARAASEAQLRESERRYAEMLDGVDMLALTLDVDGRLVYCNDALLRLTGWLREEVIGQSWARHFLPPDSPELKDVLQGQQAGAPLRARSEGQVVTRHGERRTVRWSHAALLGPDGTVVGRSSIGDDITERLELERVRQASAEAAAASQARTEFLTRVSHELRTPLNAVLGFSQLLRERIGHELEPGQRQQLALVVTAGEQLRALVEDILDVSGIDTGRVGVDLVPVDLGELLDGVLRTSAPSAEAAGVQVVLASAGRAAPTLQTDALRLRQVLLNLVSNAVRFNRPGGLVTLDWVIERQDLVLSVSDNGPGLSPEQQRALFEPFPQASAGGTGMGMLLSQQLVQLLGGEITVSSAPDAGTTVRVALPLDVAPPVSGPAPLDSRPGALPASAPSPAPSPAPPPPSAAPAVPAAPAAPTEPALAAQPEAPVAPAPAPAEGEPRGRVLYVEDNETNALLVRELLTRWPGVELRVAIDGASGLREAEAWRPDLLLLDMQLPDMDGLRVLERLRAHPATRALRVVVLSASAMPADVDQARRAGALDYWTKPIDFGAFLEGLRRLLTAETAER